jgi:hypothetical protein
MKIDLRKKYVISGLGLAMLVDMIPSECLDEQEDVLNKCVIALPSPTTPQNPKEREVDGVR